MSEPLSWLTLERYALGELPAEHVAEVEARLAVSPEDRALLEEIQKGMDADDLPPLPLPAQDAAAADNDQDEPLSWLTLERYALGELSPDRLAEVEARLADSPRERALLGEIENDTAAFDLPPLPVPLASRLWRVPPTTWLGGGLVAAAAALLLMIQPDPAPGMPGASVQMKGGDVAIRVVAQRSAEGRFAQGESLKVQFTCPPSFEWEPGVRVFQGDGVYDPLPGWSGACGNQQPWPGAFALDGQQPAHVCVVWETGLGASRPDEVGEDGVCTTLTPGL